MSYPAEWRRVQMEVWARILKNQEQQALREERIIKLLHALLVDVSHNPFDAIIQQVGDPMNPLAPGQAGIKIQFVLLPAGYDSPQSVQFSFSSSDPLVTLTTDPSDITGATQDLAIDPTETVGASVTITGTAVGVNKDGSTLSITATPFVFTVVAGVTPPPPSNPPTSGEIVQVA